MSKVRLRITLTMDDLEATAHEYEAEWLETGNISRATYCPAESGAGASEHLDFFRAGDGKLMTVRRIGPGVSMVFEQDKVLPGHIRTVAGDFPISTRTDLMAETLTDTGRRIELRYRLYLGMADRGDCELVLEIMK